MNLSNIEGIKVRLIEPKFIHTQYCDNYVLNAVHLENMRILYTEILDGQDDLSDIKLMVEFEGSIEISHDISERYLADRIRPKKGEALVSNNPRTLEFLKGASALMGQSHPVKVFTTVEEAKIWLESI